MPHPKRDEPLDADIEVVCRIWRGTYSAPPRHGQVDRRPRRRIQHDIVEIHAIAGHGVTQVIVGEPQPAAPHS